MNIIADITKRFIEQIQSIESDSDSATEVWLTACADIAGAIEQASNSSWLTHVIKAADVLPLSLRECPAAWFEDLLEGRKQDLLGLVRCLSEDQLLQLSDQGNLSRLFRSPNLRHLRLLDLRYDFEFETRIDEHLCNEDLFALAGIENYFPEVIRLCHGVDHKGIAAVIRSPIMAHCRSLDLEGANARVDDIVEALIDSTYTGALRGLNLNSTSFSEKPGHRLHLTDGLLAKLIQSKLGRQLRELRVSSYSLTEAGIRELAYAFEELKIERLDLSRCDGPEAILHLASSPNIRRLKELVYRDAEADDNVAKAIARSAVLAEELEVLELFRCKLTPAGASELARSPFLQNLKRIDLSASQRIGDAGVIEFAEADWFSSLEDVDLGCVAMSDEGLEVVLESGFRPRSLSIAFNRIKDPLRYLIQASECLSELRDLKLSIDCNETGEFYGEFANLASLSKLRRLSIAASSCKKVGGLVVELAKSSTIKGLTGLDFGNCEFNSAEPAKAIAESENFGQLKVLNLGGGKVGDAGAAAIAGSRKLPKLSELNLSRNRLTDSSVQAFADSDLTANLKSLILDENDFSSAINEVIRSSELSNMRRLIVQAIRFFHEESQHMAIRFTREIEDVESKI